MDDDEPADEKTGPWGYLLLALIAFATGALFLFLDELHAVATVADERDLVTSQGIIIALEWEDDNDHDVLDLRLSDSTRWYVLSPYVRYRQDEVERWLRQAPRGTIVTVWHDKRRDPEPADGSHWRQVAYAVSIGDYAILTYADVVAARERNKPVGPIMAGFLALWGLAYVVAALNAFRRERAPAP